MRWSPGKLKSTYRDQLIRELQHLAAMREVTFSDDVTEVMHAIDRDAARRKRRAVRAQRQPGTSEEHAPSRSTNGYSPFWKWMWRKRTIRHDDILEASELYLLEATLIEHLDVQDLKVRIAVFRDLLSNLLTAPSYRAIADQFCDLLSEGDEARLRGEARALASRLYRRYEGVPAVERLRHDIMRGMLLVTLAVSLAVWMLIQFADAPVLAWAATAGAAGAFVSTMSRLYDLDSRHEPFQTWLTIENGQMTLLLAPLVGAIFALVLLTMFLGNMVSGILFPRFPNGIDPGVADFGKLMFWSFASGWAERLIPDVLDKLSPKFSDKLGNWRIERRRRT